MHTMKATFKTYFNYPLLDHCPSNRQDHSLKDFWTSTTVQVGLVATAILSSYLFDSSKMSATVTAVTILHGAALAFHRLYGSATTKVSNNDTLPFSQLPIQKVPLGSDTYSENPNNEIKIDETVAKLGTTGVVPIERPLTDILLVTSNPLQLDSPFPPTLAQFREPSDARRDFGEQLKSLDINEKKELVLLEDQICTIPLGVRSGSLSGASAEELRVKLQSLTSNQMAYLAHSEKFWTTVTDPYLIKSSAAGLTAAHFEILTEYCVNHVAGNKIIGLNQLIVALEGDDKNLANKLHAIAKSGHPGINEQAFTFKLQFCKDRKQEILDCLVKNKKFVLQIWKPTNEVAPPIKNNSTPTRHPTVNIMSKPIVIPTVSTREWSNEEILNFVENVLGNLHKEACFNQIERMNESSLKRLIEHIGNNHINLTNLWDFERLVINAKSSVEKRQQRLAVILSNIKDDQIISSGKIGSFWEVITNTNNDHSKIIIEKLSGNQLSTLVSIIPSEKIDCLYEFLNGFVPPKTEQERVILRSKLVEIKTSFDQHPLRIKNLIPLQTINTIQSTILAKMQAIQIKGDK